MCYIKKGAINLSTGFKMNIWRITLKKNAGTYGMHAIVYGKESIKPGSK